MDIIELIKVVILGIIEGITEWLPISSTGHMILADEFIKLKAAQEFKDMFFVVIQLGAILAVVVIYFKKLWPFGMKDGRVIAKKNTWIMWFKIIVACIPASVLGILLDDWLDENLHTPVVIAIMLIVYGIWFIVIENRNKGKEFEVNSIDELSYKKAFGIGAFQVLSLIPGTSRSGSTIIGGLTLGVARPVVAEFTFFLAIPIMFGASFVKIMKFGFDFTSTELVWLAVGMVVAFLVSFLVIKLLMSYIRKHDFKVFGYYRIALGIIVLAYFGIKTLV